MKTVQSDRRKPFLNNSLVSESLHRIRSHTLYNIQDYLPDTEPVDQYIFRERNLTSLQASFIKVKTEGEDYSEYEIKNNPQSKLSDLKGEIEKLKRQNSDLVSSLEQGKELINEKEEKIKLLEGELRREKEQNKFLSEQLEKSNKKMKLSEGIAEQLEKMKKNQISKKSALTFFSAKYQYTLQPIHKHSYTIEVQTQPMEKQPYPEDLLQFYQQKPPQNQLGWSQRKVSQPTKTNFYQKYQEKQEGELTQRSKGHSSVTKPRRPRLLSDIENQKENERKRINDRIQRKKDWKHKIRDEEVEVYPIEEDKLNSIIEGILKGV